MLVLHMLGEQAVALRADDAGKEGRSVKRITKKVWVIVDSKGMLVDSDVDGAYVCTFPSRTAVLNMTLAEGDRICRATITVEVP